MHQTLVKVCAVNTLTCKHNLLIIVSYLGFEKFFPQGGKRGGGTGKQAKERGGWVDASHQVM